MDLKSSEEVQSTPDLVKVVDLTNDVTEGSTLDKEIKVGSEGKNSMNCNDACQEGSSVNNLDLESDNVEVKQTSSTIGLNGTEEISISFKQSKTNESTNENEVAVNILECENVKDSENNLTIENFDDVETNNIVGKVSSDEENLCKPIILTNKALCANYRSDTDSDSLDSESDSSDSSTDSLSDSESNENDTKNCKTGKKFNSNSVASELSVSNLPPIEDLKISVPEQECVEIGVILSIVDTLVIVESYKGTAALDIDTVLFLDCGKRPLGRVFEILGPVSEPVYAVRFNDQNEITSKMIVKGLKVYYAPQTQHTTFVHLSEVLKCKGSDASWKDNVEAPSEFQDFSDDEEENRFKRMNNSKSEDGISDEPNVSRKRTFSAQRQSDKILQPSRFKNTSTPNPRFPFRGRFRSSHPRNPFASAQGRPPYPVPPNTYTFVPRSGVPMGYYPPTVHPAQHFPGCPPQNFGNLQFANPHAQGMRPPYFTQRPQVFPGSYGMQWPVACPPPPPPPKKDEFNAQQ